MQRWSHLPFNNVSCAVTMSTDVGWVQAVVFSDGSRALERFRVVETPPTASRSGRYEYRVSDWPDPSEQPAWESSYRWFFTVRNNWLLVTTDTRPEHSHRVFRALRAPKQLIIVPGARHNESLRPDVWPAVETWIDRVVLQPR